MVDETQIFPRHGLDAARRALRSAKAVVCDIDGVLLIDGEVADGAAELIESRRCVFASNNSTHTSVTLAEHFNRLGLDCRAQQFFLAGETAVEYLACRCPESRVMVLASDDVQRLAYRHLNIFESFMLRPNQRPDWVLICRDRTLTFEKLEAAANAIRLGAGVVVSNLDVTHPSQNGLIHTETGALWNAVLAQTHREVPEVIIGKPETCLLERAVDYLGYVPQDLVFLGDNLKTDARSAQKMGITFIHVGGEGFRLSELLDR